MHFKWIFEKYQHNFECALSIFPKIKTTSPFFQFSEISGWGPDPGYQSPEGVGPTAPPQNNVCNIVHLF